MKSPFPGMDPYLDAHWLDVHATLVTSARDMLNQRLPEDLIARSEERLAIDAPDWEVAMGYRPDVQVFSPGRSDPETEGGLMIEAPFKLVVDLEPFTERFIKIIHPEDQRLITVIEFISPTNKHGKGMEKYQAKREELQESGVNVVEVDLCRRGDWRMLLRPHSCPREAVATYRTVVRPGGQRRGAYLYPMPLNKPLPAIPIPLRPEDPQVLLELQPLIDQAYVNGRYSRTIDYRRPPDPPLEGDDSAWAAELLKSASR
jgi:hypothetical protein